MNGRGPKGDTWLFHLSIQRFGKEVLPALGSLPTAACAAQGGPRAASGRHPLITVEQLAWRRPARLRRPEGDPGWGSCVDPGGLRVDQRLVVHRQVAFGQRPGHPGGLSPGTEHK